MISLKRTSDLKAYILNKYPELNSKRFEIVKIGARIYMYYVDREGNLARQQVFQGHLPSIEGLPLLHERLDKLIEYAVKKWQGVNN
jgi:hypothetical protein